MRPPCDFHAPPRRPAQPLLQPLTPQLTQRDIITHIPVKEYLVTGEVELSRTLANALLGAACTTDITAEHVYLALITPPDRLPDVHLIVAGRADNLRPAYGH